MADPEGALIIYGRGADLGDFKDFADTLAKELKPQYKAHILTQRIEKRDEFLKFLKVKRPFKVKELHIFSHSIGAGLYIGYKSAEASTDRMTAFNAAVAAGRRITYGEVVDAETGAILTDILTRPDVLKDRGEFRAIFTPDGMIKIWGCNSGVKGWRYTDETDDGRLVYDQGDTSAPYYWRALNLQKVPKPSIAQAFADFFDVATYGATSGSDVQIKYGGKWISSEAYKKDQGHWPSGTLPHHLRPTKGRYNEYKPTPSPP